MILGTIDSCPCCDARFVLVRDGLKIVTHRHGDGDECTASGQFVTRRSVRTREDDDRCNRCGRHLDGGHEDDCGICFGCRYDLATGDAS